MTPTGVTTITVTNVVFNSNYLFCAMAIIESNDPLVALVSINNITIEVKGGTVFITEDGSESVIRISISLCNWVTEDFYSATLCLQHHMQKR